jgi:hypothetical protein
MLRILLVIVLGAAALWTGYWFVGARGMDQALAGWFEARRADGWVAHYDELSVTGFPNRFDVNLAGPELADPDTGLAWQAPFFQILALSYRPNHVIAVWPPESRLATPHETYGLEADDMRASLVLRPGPRLALDRATLTARTLNITRDARAGTTAVADLSLAAERAPADDAPAYRLGLRAQGLAPPIPWRNRVDPQGSLPDTFDTVRADLTVTFDKPWDRTAIEEARPQPRRIRLRLAEARWGRLELAAAGELDVGDDGTPEGEITVKARNWREILELSVRAGALNESLAATLRDGLALVARMAGHPETLDVPLSFSGGRVRLGPVPLGRAPTLELR